MDRAIQVVGMVAATVVVLALVVAAAELPIFDATILWSQTKLFRQVLQH
jgi:hypothetical protein